MDGDDVMYSVAVALVYFAMALMYGSALLALVSAVVACIRRCRSRRDVDRLLDTVDDVPYYYHSLPGDDEEDQRSLSMSSSCVICLAEYEHGEGCFVLPGCAHTFHRNCIAPWLRQGNNSCPICRATVTTKSSAEQHHTMNPEAENMV